MAVFSFIFFGSAHGGTGPCLHAGRDFTPDGRWIKYDVCTLLGYSDYNVFKVIGVLWYIGVKSNSKKHL
jgi:hypothetical protein